MWKQTNMEQRKHRLIKKNTCLVSAAILLALTLSTVNPMVAKIGDSSMPKESGLRINIDPADQIFGASFSITVSGLKPGEQATIKAPILLVSGTDDQTWPSAEFSDKVMERLEKFGHPYEHKHVRYKDSGHQVFLPYFITGPNRSMKGGNVKDEVRGSLASWTETIAFLRRHLDR